MPTENLNKKELPISREKLEKMTMYLDGLNVDVGAIIEMTPQIKEIIGNYKEEFFLVRNVEILGHNLFKVEFVFPVYNVVTGELPNEHVSMVQMDLAILQGIFMSVGLSIKQNKISSPMSYETFLLNRGEILYRRDQRTMRKKLKFHERCHLIFRLREPIKKGNMYTITIDLVKDKDAFLDGWVEGLIQDQYLFDEEKKNFKENKDTENILPQTIVGNVLTRFDAHKNLKDAISMTDGKNETELETKTDIEKNQ